MTFAQAVSDVVPDIPLDRREIVYPRMTPAQLARIASYEPAGRFVPEKRSTGRETSTFTSSSW